MEQKTGFFEDAPRSFSMGRLLSFILVVAGVLVTLVSLSLLFMDFPERIAVAGTGFAAGMALIVQGLGAKAVAKHQEGKEA